MKKLGLLLCVLLTSCFLLQSCGGGSTSASSVGSMAAMIPDGDVVIHFDQKGMEKAPIYTKLQDKSDDDKDKLLSMLDVEKEVFDELKQALGIEDEDIVGYTIALKLEGVDFDALEKDPSKLPFVAGCEVAKEITNEQLLKAAEIITKKKG